jgi:predicted permease
MAALRLAVRSLVRSPGFAFFAVVTLALGIGANTALFSLFDQVILRPLPVTDPSRLVVFHSEGPNTGRVSSDNYETSFSYPLYEDLKTRLAESFEGLIVRAPANVSVAGLGEPDVTSGDLVSGNFFTVLGLRPATGRLITPSDDQPQNPNPVVVLSYAYWREHFGGRADIAGQKIIINNHPMEIIGVAPRGFLGLVSGNTPSVYFPIHALMLVRPGAQQQEFQDRRSAWMNIFGRLRSGIGQAQAQAEPAYRAALESELDTLKDSTANFRRDYVAKKLQFLPGGQGINVLRKRYENELAFLMGMVGLILLIACANVANLLTVRAIGRRKEFAVRLSLGANRGTIIRQLLLESILLAVAGSLAAALLAYWLQTALTKFVEGLTAGLDWRAFAFNFTLALVTTFLFGLVPALQASNPNLAGVLKDEAGSVSGNAAQGRARQVLVLIQLGLALVLLTAAGLFGRSLWNLESVDTGFRTDRVLTFRLSPMLNGYSFERAQQLFDEMPGKLAAIPGVEQAAAALTMPLSGMNMMSNITIEGYTAGPDESLDVHMNFVSPHYFDAMGIPLLGGRDFADRDQSQSPKVVIVNEAFSRKWLKGANPLGRHLSFGAGNKIKLDMEIVGIVRDQVTGGLRDKPVEFVYSPITQWPANMRGVSLGMAFVVRAARDEDALAASVREVVRQTDSNLPLRKLEPLSRIKAKVVSDDRLISLLTTAFGLLATMLAALGLYGVLAYTVAQRTKEIGIRIALGASKGSVVTGVMRAMLFLLGIGLAIGLGGVYVVGRWAESLLFGLKGFDPLVIGGAVATLGLVTLLAAFVPALRAARTDPVTALRHE